MKPHEIQFFKGRSGSIFTTHPGLQGVYNAQTGNVYPELPITAVAIPRDSVLGSDRITYFGPFRVRRFGLRQILLGLNSPTGCVAFRCCNTAANLQ